MKRFWKWTLGVALVLVLCAAAAGTFFALKHRYVAREAPIIRADRPGKYAWGMPMHREFYGPSAPQLPREFGHGAYPHMGIRHGYGSMPFGGAFMLAGGLVRLFVPLVILGLVAFGAYALGKQAGTRAATSPVAGMPQATHEVAEKEGDESPQ